MTNDQRREILYRLSKECEVEYNGVTFEDNCYNIGAVAKGDYNVYQVNIYRDGSLAVWRYGNDYDYRDIGDDRDRLEKIVDTWLTAHINGDLDDNYRFPCSYRKVDPLPTWDDVVASFSG